MYVFDMWLVFLGTLQWNTYLSIRSMSLILMRRILTLEHILVLLASDAEFSLISHTHFLSDSKEGYPKIYFIGN
jgi:hypothetical protein